MIMTEEQIRQNAEAYATEHYDEYDEHDYIDRSGSNMCHAVSKKAFIAGAHSSNEEAKELQLAYNNLVNSFNERGRELAKASQELNKLRNPWISVEDRLPEEGQQILEAYTMECTESGLKSFDEEILFSCYRGKFVCDGKETNYGIGKSKSTTHHWMPIPELKKGE